MTITCQKLGCTNPATHEAILEMRSDRDSQPSYTTAIVRVCDDHRQIELEELIGDKDAWETIRNTFLLRGLRPPKRMFTRVIVRPLLHLQ